MRILDQYGNPIDTGVLKEAQTAQAIALQHAMVQSQLDGLTPARAARILRDADNGDMVAQHRLFDDMFDRDAHIQCEYAKRRDAPLTLDWSIEPPANASRAERKAADMVQDLLKNAVDDLEDVITAMMDGPGYGFAPIELEWAQWSRQWLPRFNPRPQWWFRQDTLRRELRLDVGGADGEAIRPMGWIFHIHRKVKTGYLSRMGLFRCVLWPFMYKAYSVGDWAEFLEIYGLPFIIGKYMNGATPEEKNSLARAVNALGHDARAIMPEGMALEMPQVSHSGSGNPHLAMIEWAERSQSKAILGQILSADAKSTGLGSGVADLHADVRHDILISDARQLAGTLTRDLVYPLAVLNGAAIDGMLRCPRFVFDTGEAEDMAAYKDALPVFAAGGMRIPLDWVHEKLRIPEAEDGAPVFGAKPEPTPPAPGATPPQPEPPPAPDPNAPPKAATSAWRLAALAAARPVPDPADALTALLGPEADPVVRGWLEDILGMLDSADSLEEFRAQLLTRYGHLPAADLVTVMQQALAAAALAGRSEVQDGR